MYFLTDPDPNYSIKGSRDPLGFQVIWQPAARKLIPYLSTVSTSLKDFQILCIAFALQEELNISEKDFEPFFIRFEQLMAYSRYSYYPEEGFNGIDKVRKKMSQNPNSVLIANSSEAQILSNQRAYGIWGKYIRPFNDMKLAAKKILDEIFKDKIKGNKEFMSQVTLLKHKTISDNSYASIEKFKHWENLLQKPVGQERELFIDKLLDDTCGNFLLEQFNNNPEWLNLSFYTLIRNLLASSENPRINDILSYILNTENVLSPLNRIFRYLQTRSYWKNEEIKKDDFIKKWRTTPSISGFDDITLTLANLLNLENLDLVKGLITRNEEVARWRNSSPWMQLTNNGLEVNHFEGGFSVESYDPQNDNDYNYFLTTYISLHKQLQWTE
jgi:hypothetical protein